MTLLHPLPPDNAPPSDALPAVAPPADAAPAAATREPTPTTPRRTRTPLRAAAIAITVIAVAGVTVISLIGFALGWRMHAMTTPSMGRTAPVGSVVLTSPVAIEDVHVGEIISFDPPGRDDTAFVHRIVSINHNASDTTLRTKGDINGSVDGWVLTGHNLTGRERVVIPDLGFLLQMLPLLLLGSLLIALLTSKTRRERRGPLRIGLFSLLSSFLLWHFQPLSRVDLLTQTIAGGKGHATIVPTGALPVRVQATGGTHTDLGPGQLGAVAREHLPPSGHFTVSSAIHLTGWWWLLALLWLAPLAVSLRYTRTGLNQPNSNNDSTVDQNEPPHLASPHPVQTRGNSDHNASATQPSG